LILLISIKKWPSGRRTFATGPSDRRTGPSHAAPSSPRTAQTESLRAEPSRDSRPV